MNTRAGFTSILIVSAAFALLGAGCDGSKDVAGAGTGANGQGQATVKDCTLPGVSCTEEERAHGHRDGMAMGREGTAMGDDGMRHGAQVGAGSKDCSAAGVSCTQEERRRARPDQ